MTTKTSQAKTTKPAHPATTDGEVRVAIYLRISTDEEHQPYSLEAQEQRLGAYVASQPGWTLVRTFVDQASGATIERPALAQALTEARAGRYDLLLVYRVDRLAAQCAVSLRSLKTSKPPAPPSAPLLSPSTPPPRPGG
jgi:site-specific DNA recombinase